MEWRLWGTLTQWQCCRGGCCHVCFRASFPRDIASFCFEPIAGDWWMYSLIPSRTLTHLLMLIQKWGFLNILWLILLILNKLRSVVTDLVALVLQEKKNGLVKYSFGLEFYWKIILELTFFIKRRVQDWFTSTIYRVVQKRTFRIWSEVLLDHIVDFSANKKDQLISVYELTS